MMVDYEQAPPGSANGAGAAGAAGAFLPYPPADGQRVGRVVLEAVHSPALAGNRLGDPAVRYTPVYLPPEYAAEPERRFPVIYWLHGFTGTAFGGLSWRPWEPSLPELMDRASRQTGTPAILVLVDGFTKYGGSQYLNSSYNGRYEDYVVRDVVSHVDARYRTIAAPAGRAVAGKSSGGYGALVLGMRHPDVFGALASVSGDCYFELCYKPDFPKLLGQIARHGGVQAFLDAFLALPKKSGEAVGAINMAAMAMAYSPNPAHPLGFELPFDTYSGEIDAAVWARWEAHDPVHLVATHAAHLRQLRLVYLEAGTRDEYHLQYGARILHRRLEEHGVAHEHAEFDDGHGGINYRYDVALGKLLAALSPAGRHY
jgi:enterochelin esterase family protein